MSHPESRVAAGPTTGRVVNVCFHGIGRPRRELEPGEAAYWVGRDQFRRLLDELAGWPAVRLSFDDGNRSDVDIALPELRDRGLVADFFPVAGRIGAAGSLAAADLAELRRHGMRVGSHGMRHRPWRDLDPAGRHEELVVARHVIAAAAGAPVEVAACPLGRYDRRLLTELRRLGYRHVFTSDRRPARAGAWLQPRYSVRRDDTPATLRRQLYSPARVWRGAVVGLVKRLR